MNVVEPIRSLTCFNRPPVRVVAPVSARRPPPVLLVVAGERLDLPVAQRHCRLAPQGKEIQVVGLDALALAAARQKEPGGTIDRVALQDRPRNRESANLDQRSRLVLGFFAQQGSPATAEKTTGCCQCLSFNLMPGILHCMYRVRTQVNRHDRFSTCPRFGLEIEDDVKTVLHPSRPQPLKPAAKSVRFWLRAARVMGQLTPSRENALLPNVIASRLPLECLTETAIPLLAPLKAGSCGIRKTLLLAAFPPSELAPVQRGLPGTEPLPL
jgi:hypothetical protein